MKKCALCFTFVFVTLITATPPDVCESCVSLSKCAQLTSMSKQDQEFWIKKYPCNNHHPGDYGTPPGAEPQADFICCPNQIWGVEPKDRNSSSPAKNRFGRLQVTPSSSADQNQDNYDNVRLNNDNDEPSNNQWKVDSHGSTTQNPQATRNIEPSRWPTTNKNDYWNQRPDRNKWDIGNKNFYHGNDNRNTFNNNRRNYTDNDQSGGGNQEARRNQPNDRSNDQGYGRSGNQPDDRSNDQGYRRSGYQPGDRSNDQGYGRSGNQPGERSNDQGYGRSGTQPGDRTNDQGYGKSGNQPGDRTNDQGYGRSDRDNQYSNDPNKNNRQSGDTFGKPGQCDRLTRFPPDPLRGCCGREASDDDRIIDAPNYNFAPDQGKDPDCNWSLSTFKEESTNTLTVDNKTVTVVNGTEGDNSTVTVDSRISGGKATELTQFPWTALLLATFHNGNQQTAFNCGGSLISSKFVLTAGHCVYDAEAVLKSVQVFLAEFDKRSFPRDCKTTPEGRKCIDNISIYSENVILHPRFDETRLLNDIALITLQSDAPYTEFIRPICLPSINIDSPEHNRLPLTVAGWGRNGQYKTDIKQSTTVHLVPQTDCKKFYPDLTTRHLCAAGYSGEDTCKGDSGGPLMVRYRGVYYVVGVVSGKRTDAPCGSAVPSLYTNVYHYLDWIRSNVGN